MILRGTLYSKVLEMDTGVTVLTPPEYRGGELAKVAYILHGLYGNNGNWSDYTMLPLYVREYNVVCVMPEVSRSFYCDMAFGQRFFSYVADELPEICRSAFNITGEAGGTAVIGGSMGGYGALKCALSRPGRYGYCVALSPALLYLREDLERLRSPYGVGEVAKVYSGQLVRDFESIFGLGLEWRGRDDLMELAEGFIREGGRTRFYRACGLGDGMRANSIRFRDAMVGMGVGVEYEEWDGGHDWRFFDRGIERALRFCFG